MLREGEQTLAGVTLEIVLVRDVEGLAESFTYILQMPSLYFDVEVEPLSYVLAVVLSFGFTFIVNLATNRTLNKIDMVGALKSAE